MGVHSTKIVTVRRRNQQMVGLDFDGDGWTMNVGQVYSNPYEVDHIQITKIEITDPDLQNAKVYFRYVDANDYTKVLTDDENLWHRAWFINEQWGLEEWDKGDEEAC